MEKARCTNENEYYIRCPKCDKLLMQVIAAEGCKMKCWNCNRKYLITVKYGSISIELISKPKED